MKSTLWTLQVRDFLKGLVMAILVPALVIIQQSITAGDLVFNWGTIWKAAVAGLVGYLIKNFFTDDTKVAVKTLAAQNVTIIDNGGATLSTTDAKITPRGVN